MSDAPNRSRLSLPLKNINARCDAGVSEGANIGSGPTQRKLMKGLSTPPVYFVSAPFDTQISSSSSTLNKSRSCPLLNRAQSIRDTISDGTVKFFGVPLSKNYQLSIDALIDQKWSCRRLRFICRHYGNPKDVMMRELKPQNVVSILDDLSDVPSPSKSITSQSEIREAVFMTSSIGTVEAFPRNKSVGSRRSQITQQYLERRESVMKMVSDGIFSMMQRGTLRPKMICTTVKRGRSISGSFAPFSVQQIENIAHIRIGLSAIDVFTEVGSENHKMMNSNKPKKQNEEGIKAFLFKKNSHFPSEVEAAALVSIPKKVTGHNEPLLYSELKKYDTSSIVKSKIQTHTATGHEVVEGKNYAASSDINSVENEVFFDYISPTASSSISDTEREGRTSPLHSYRSQELPDRRFSFITRLRKSCSEDDQLEDGMGNFRKKVGKMGGSQAQETQPQCSKEEKSTPFASLCNALSSPKVADRKTTKRTIETCRNVRKTMLDTICRELKSKKYYVSYRRHFGSGFGIWRKYFQRTYRKDVYRLSEDTYIDYRPFFTYWITTVQILVTIGSLYTYGVGPWGFGRTERTADVLHTTVTLKRVSIYVQQNVWFGPKFADLVHLGAKFTPCMREDPKIFEQIKADHMEENKTGCCIYNDGTGCFQTGQSTCPSLIATLVRWKENRPGPEGRVSGAVCGQDPRYCDDPVSVKPYEWPDEITQWPICKQRTLFVPENVMHMQCENTGRPCCIQLHGQCRITTRDYCDFVEGYFHENATLCSQVLCLSKICGMLPFLQKNRPDQWYRLFIPLFLHAGDLEKLLGWARVALLYMVSGIGGYLAGAIFVPYQAKNAVVLQPEVGPAGSHVGMFATMYVDVLYSWDLLERPWHAVLQLSLFTVALFILGTLPWVDNWAHLFGFIFGILISFAVLPYIQTKRRNRTRRLLIVVISLSAALGLFILLLAMFYWPSSFNCVYCEYFNCIPYTDHFCDNQGLRLKNWLPI